MNLFLKVAVGLFLLVQASHLAPLQSSTDTPGRPIDNSWWRRLTKIKDGSENTALSAEEEYDPEAEGTGMESGNDYSGIASGSITGYSEEEENVARKDKDADESNSMDVVTTALPLNVTTQQPEVQNSTNTPVTAMGNQTNSSNANSTKAEEEFHNTTTVLPSAANTTSHPDFSNQTDFNTTTLTPDVNATQETTTKSQNDTKSINTTESVNTTTVAPSSQTTIPETTQTTTVLSSTLSDFSTTEFVSTTPTIAPTNTSEKGNETDKAAASGSSSDRGLASDSNSRRHSSWGAILGTAVAVICVGLVAYVILKNKHKKDFSHRKLVEEFPSDPVHRLDNNEPLDLNFGGSAYYNPGLQGDNIQMTNFPGRR